MQLIKLNELKPHESNDYFFDDITGDNWTEFLKSVESSGVIEPVIITQNKVIVSGHQRVRACKELSITEVPCEIRIYDSEEKILKDLLETNLRQRGIGNTNPIKLSRCIVELEKIYGIHRGGSRDSNGDNLHLKTQTELADQFDMSERQLRDYKKLLTLIPELQDSIEYGKLSPTLGYKVLAKLSKQEQEKLIFDFGGEYISSLTQKKAQELIKSIREEKEILKTKLQKALEKPNKVIDITDYELIDFLGGQLSSLEAEKKQLEEELSNRPTVEKEVTPSDYEDLKKKLEDSHTYFDNLKRDHESKTKQLNQLQAQLKAMTEVKPEQQYAEKLKEDAIIFCAKVERFISEVGGLAYLSNHIYDLPKNEQKAYIRTVELVEAWAVNIIENFKQIQLVS